MVLVIFALLQGLVNKNNAFLSERQLVWRAIRQLDEQDFHFICFQ